MDNPSFLNYLELETLLFTDDSANESTAGHVLDIVSMSPPAYRAIDLLDRLSAYSSVFGCSATCHA